ncbi:MAG: hypothetical protein H6837_00955 [Planctomycetes bacterium]|nr:hypothetical protein [Planctomycetota bacterium]
MKNRLERVLRDDLDRRCNQCLDRGDAPDGPELGAVVELQRRVARSVRHNLGEPDLARVFAALDEAVERGDTAPPPRRLHRGPGLAFALAVAAGFLLSLLVWATSGLHEPQRAKAAHIIGRAPSPVVEAAVLGVASAAALLHAMRPRLGARTARRGN